MTSKTSTINSPSKTDINDNPLITRPGGYYGYASFVLCGSCFWCASDLSGGKRIEKCSACNVADMIESIPLAPKEKYVFGIDPKRGIVLDFAPL